MINKKKFFVILLAAIFFIFVVINSFFLTKKSYFISIPITFGNHDYPLINVKIDNEFYPIEVDIGSSFPLFLSKEILDKFEKRSSGFYEWLDESGKYFKTPIYFFPKIEINNLVIKEIKVGEVVNGSSSNYGRIGGGLGGDFNILLDFPNSRIVACHSFSKLKREKIANEDWIKIPFKIGPAGLYVEAKTDIGITNLLLNTTSSKSYIKSSLIKDKKLWKNYLGKDYFHSNKFSIENHEFNGIDLLPYEFLIEHESIDGFIGINLLKRFSVYIDFENEFLYIEPPPQYFVRLPTKFDRYMTPYTLVKVGGEDYYFEFDLGSSFPFSLNQGVLKKINQNKCGTVEWMDYKGNQYQSPEYLIPKIEIGSLIFDNVLGKEDLDEFHKNTSFNGTIGKHDGLIGWPILEKFNLFLDFPKSAVYACNSLSTLEEKGLISNEVLKVPFTCSENGIILEIQTDFGVNYFILDTGATATVIKKTFINQANLVCEEANTFQIFVTSKFIIGKKDFGEKKLVFLDVHPDFQFDGYLGMDFLKDYRIFIDYFNRIIYIDDLNKN